MELELHTQKAFQSFAFVMIRSDPFHCYTFRAADDSRRRMLSVSFYPVLEFF